jgi:multisubunit Na+/H+ antiporter MnhG subunit
MLRLRVRGKEVAVVVMVITSPVTRVIVSRACKEDHYCYQKQITR